MKKFFSFRALKWIIALILALTLGLFFYVSDRNKVPSGTLIKVDRGTVEELVSISGTLELTNSASLTFSQNGIVKEVLVNEGSVVTKGQILAVLDNRKQEAEKKDAAAYRDIQIATRNELLNGPSGEAREVSTLAVSVAKNNLSRTKGEQDELVENARRTLLSSDLAAIPLDYGIDDTPPTITGTYSCQEGEYRFKTSGAQGGRFGFTLSGLESGTYKAEIDSPGTFGTCGLFIQFADESYADAKWVVEIPNKRSASYAANQNAYTLAQEKRKNAIAAAEDALAQAQKNESLDNALPRNEALLRADANIRQAESRIDSIQADMEQRIIRAPFDGVVSNVSFLPGEENTKGTIELTSEKGFELKVRIPEIDITKVALNNKARVRLDARDNETLMASVGFISPTATEIDGVSYYEALLYLEQIPEWLRGGLNADVDIVTNHVENVLRLPERYIRTENGNATVSILENNEKVSRGVELDFRGNDGYVEVKNLPEGFEVITP